MKIGSGLTYGLGYPSSRSKYSAHKTGLTGLKATPRGYSGGSDKDSISGRSRKGKSRQGLYRLSIIVNMSLICVYLLVFIK